MKFLKLLLIKNFRWKAKSQPLSLSRVFNSKLSRLLETTSWHTYRNPIFRHLACKPSSPQGSTEGLFSHVRCFRCINPTRIFSRQTTPTVTSKEKAAPLPRKKNPKTLPLPVKKGSKDNFFLDYYWFGVE